MSGWGLFWFVVAVLLIARGVSWLGVWMRSKIEAWRNNRRLASMQPDKPENERRVMFSRTGGVALGGKPGTEERIAVNTGNGMVFATLTSGIHTIIVPMPDGEVCVFRRTDECIPDGDSLAVVFR